VSDRGTPSEDDIRALVALVHALGGTDEEIRQAAPVAGLGPLVLELALRPSGRSVPFETYVAESHIDPELVRRIWSALGLPESTRMPFLVTPDAARAIEVIAFLVNVLDEEAALGFARVIGSSVARIADALASAIRVGVEIPQLDTGVT
jgi:hypothetical protein